MDELSKRKVKKQNENKLNSNIQFDPSAGKTYIKHPCSITNIVGIETE